MTDRTTRLISLLLFRDNDPDGTSTVVLPLFWRFHQRQSDRATTALLPFFLHREAPHDTLTAAGVFPLWGYHRSFTDGGWSDGLFPLAFFGSRPIGGHAVVFPLFWHLWDAKGTATALFPLFFARSNRHGYDVAALPLLTFFGRRDRTSYQVQFPLFWRFTDGDRSMAVTPLGFYGSSPDGWRLGVGPLLPIVWAAGGGPRRQGRDQLHLVPLRSLPPRRADARAGHAPRRVGRGAHPPGRVHRPQPLVSRQDVLGPGHPGCVRGRLAGRHRRAHAPVGPGVRVRSAGQQVPGGVPVLRPLPGRARDRHVRVPVAVLAPDRRRLQGRFVPAALLALALEGSHHHRRGAVLRPRGGRRARHRPGALVFLGEERRPHHAGGAAATNRPPTRLQGPHLVHLGGPLLPQRVGQGREHGPVPAVLVGARGGPRVPLAGPFLLALPGRDAEPLHAAGTAVLVHQGDHAPARAAAGGLVHARRRPAHGQRRAGAAVLCGARAEAVHAADAGGGVSPQRDRAPVLRVAVLPGGQRRQQHPPAVPAVRHALHAQDRDAHHLPAAAAVFLAREPGEEPDHGGGAVLAAAGRHLGDDAGAAAVHRRARLPVQPHHRAAAAVRAPRERGHGRECLVGAAVLPPRDRGDRHERLLPAAL